MLKTKEKIEDWLNKHEIKNYIINDDLTVDVNGDVRLEGRGIKKILVKFNKVIGDFNIGVNYLRTLKGMLQNLLFVVVIDFCLCF